MTTTKAQHCQNCGRLVQRGLSSLRCRHYGTVRSGIFQCSRWYPEGTLLIDGREYPIQHVPTVRQGRPPLHGRPRPVPIFERIFFK